MIKSLSLGASGVTAMMSHKDPSMEPPPAIPVGRKGEGGEGRRRRGGRGRGRDMKASAATFRAYQTLGISLSKQETGISSQFMSLQPSHLPDHTGNSQAFQSWQRAVPGSTLTSHSLSEWTHLRIDCQPHTALPRKLSFLKSFFSRPGGLEQ